jgi:hypothetical protein
MADSFSKLVGSGLDLQPRLSRMKLLTRQLTSCNCDAIIAQENKGSIRGIGEGHAAGQDHCSWGA